MARSRLALLGVDDPVNLSHILHVPDTVDDKRYKCRICYGRRIGDAEYSRYEPRRTGSLKIVESESIDYTFKYSDRSAINALFELRGDCDDIIVSLEGKLTDSSYSNIALYDGRNWFTPDRPLLQGTKRESLIRSGEITPRPLAVADLYRYEMVSLVNAMLDLGEIVIPITAIEI